MTMGHKALTGRIELFKFNSAIAALIDHVSRIGQRPTRPDVEALALLP
jgi:hypothetical protein